jgi:hypothetical protein
MEIRWLGEVCSRPRYFVDIAFIVVNEVSPLAYKVRPRPLLRLGRVVSDKPPAPPPFDEEVSALLVYARAGLGLRDVRDRAADHPGPLV